MSAEAKSPASQKSGDAGDVRKSPEWRPATYARGLPAYTKLALDVCICARPKKLVFCAGCGYYRLGRKRIQCPKHPQVLFLYDIQTCEKCHLSCYLDEYNAK